MNPVGYLLADDERIFKQISLVMTTEICLKELMEKPRNVFRVCSLLMAILFAYSASVQLNDPGTQKRRIIYTFFFYSLSTDYVNFTVFVFFLQIGTFGFLCTYSLM